jgi:ABC-type nitrate/sulfonate/bicarbonate transport system substrate-binding protein
MCVRRLDAAGYYMSTSSSMIKDHPDAVQGMVTAMAQATKFVQTNPDEAKTIVVSHLKDIGITDADEDATLFDIYKSSVNAFPSESAFTATACLLSNVEKVTIPYSTFVDADFAQTAYQKVGLTLPG